MFTDDTSSELDELTPTSLDEGEVDSEGEEEEEDGESFDEEGGGDDTDETP